jgi:PAT family beta-lactamase induction signal transducer AmpG
MTPPAPPPQRRPLLELVALYAAEGIPYGFFAQGLPVYFREHGESLSKIGALGLLYLPWALKGFWAPWVDAHHVPGFGRRRTWILGTQVALVLCCALAAWLLGFVPFTALWPLVVVVNVLSATQDIAVDGYAVSRLTSRTRGLGNAIQVCGYKGGMLLGGGVLLGVADVVDWQAAMVGLAVSLALVLPFSWRLKEDEQPPVEMPGGQGARGVALATLAALVNAPGMPALLLLVTTVKVGEAAASAMLKPALVDHHFTATDVALWVGTLGLGASLLGSALGGWLVTALPRRRALLAGVVLQAAGLLSLAPLLLTPGHWLGVGLVVEHLVTGILTTVLFTFMMDAVDPRFGGTQYSILASLVVVGTGTGSTLSGVLADAVGYGPLFVGAAVLTLAHLGLVAPADAARARATAAREAAEKAEAPLLGGAS